MEDPTPQVTVLLKRLHDGDKTAEEPLLRLLYDQLHGMAQRRMEREGPSHTLQPTALVNEAWARLSAGGSQPDWQDRQHFLRYTARVMRHLLVDYARAKKRAKRGQRAHVPLEGLDGVMEVYDDRALDVLAIHEALERLGDMDEVLARIVELRFFAGLTVPETAEATGMSLKTTERRWRVARAWLRAEIPRPD